MAYLAPSKWDEEQQRQLLGGQPGAQAAAQPQLSSAPAPAMAPAAGPSAPATPARSVASQYPNISAYLDANKGSAQDMGQLIDKQVGGKVNQAQSDYDTGRTAWENANNQAIADWQQQNQKIQQQNLAAENAWFGQASHFDPRAGPTVGKTTWNPPSAQPTVQNGGLQDWAAAPTFSAYSPWAGGLQAGHDAQSEIQGLGTDAGRQAALQQLGGQNYSAGMDALDAAILGNANPNLSSDLSQKYAGIFSALQAGQAAPASPTAPAPFAWQPGGGMVNPLPTGAPGQPTAAQPPSDDQERRRPGTRAR